MSSASCMVSTSESGVLGMHSNTAPVKHPLDIRLVSRRNFRRHFNNKRHEKRGDRNTGVHREPLFETARSGLTSLSAETGRADFSQPSEPVAGAGSAVP